jgi:hypothetical protein
MTESTLPPQSTSTPAQGRPLRRFLRKRWQGWRARHQLPFNFALHMIGIPLAFAGLISFFFVEWYWGVAGLIVGYLLQYVGHRAEGNDLGEWAGIKRLLGLPYVGISPRWQKPAEDRYPSVGAG